MEDKNDPGKFDTEGLENETDEKVPSRSFGELFPDESENDGESDSPNLSDPESADGEGFEPAIEEAGVSDEPEETAAEPTEEEIGEEGFEYAPEEVDAPDTFEPEESEPAEEIADSSEEEGFEYAPEEVDAPDTFEPEESEPAEEIADSSEEEGFEYASEEAEAPDPFASAEEEGGAGSDVSEESFAEGYDREDRSGDEPADDTTDPEPETVGGPAVFIDPLAGRKRRAGASSVNEEGRPAVRKTEPPKKKTKTTKAVSASGRVKTSQPKAEDSEEPKRFRFTDLFAPRRKSRNFFVSVILTTAVLLVLLLAGAVAAGIGAAIGIAKAYVATTPELDLNRIEDLNESSFIYDKNGNLITTISGMENRVWAAYDEIPQAMLDAIVSVEDKRFWSHEGIDIKRIAGAFVSNLSSDSTQGGSTITQQLIKMRILGSEQTYKRKLQEAYLALELEKKYTKEEILEAYLNTIFLGQSNYGIKAAAKDYFGKELSELTIRECAMLAGLAQSPYTYDPRRNMYVLDRYELTEMRTDTVLMTMFENGYITEEEYEEALEEDVRILASSPNGTTGTTMPYFTEYAVQNVIDHMLRQRGLEDTDSNRSLIERELRTGGYHIYTTLDPEVQLAVQTVVYNYDAYPEMADPADASAVLRYSDDTSQTIQEPQASVTVVENGTGYLTAMVGGTYEPRVARATNRAWQTRMPIGSSMKPIAVYAPALEAGVSPGSVVWNIPAEIEGWGTERGYPNNYGGGGFTGATSVRTALYKSLNVVAARLLMEDVGVYESVDYLAQMGIDSESVNADGPGLALGTSGVSTLELSGAFSTFANGGEWIEPVAFTKITDSLGNVILDVEDTRIRNRVFSEATAYQMVDLLTGAVESGTGGRAKVEGLTTAGKTGTNSDYRGVAFAGFTPYYSGAVWIGSDYYKPLYTGAQGGRDAAPLFKAVMEAIQEIDGYEDKPILDYTAEDIGIYKVSYCDVSGQIAGDNCTETHKDWYVPGVTDDTECELHQKLTICGETGCLAGPYCPEDEVEESTVVLITPESYLTRFDPEILEEYLPDAIYGDLPPKLTDESVYEENYDTYKEYLCPIHTKEWKENEEKWELTVSNCESLRKLAVNRLTDLDLGYPEIGKNLRKLVAALDKAMADKNHDLDALSDAYNNLLDAYYDLPEVYVPPEETQ